MFFSHPLFLIGIVAVGIPIAVHLFNFRRYKKVYFSNVDYLQQLHSETKQQSTLRRLLILAARILVIIFLVLTFAQPIIPTQQQPLQRGGTAVSVYIDNSFSMENTNANGTLLETAKDKAREIVAAYKPSDQFQLLTNNGTGVEFRWLSRDEFLTSLEEIEISTSSPLLSSTVNKQFDFLHSSHATNLFAYQISDFQQSTTNWQLLPTDTSILSTFVPLEGVAVSNISIDTLSLSAPAFYQGSTVTLAVTLHNTSDSAITNLPLKLFVNGKQRALTSVDIAANANAEATLLFKVENDSLQHCYVETADYPITFDDRLYFAINVSQKVDMLVINGSNENPYLRKLFAEDSAIHYQSVEARNIDFSSLTRHQIIILNEVNDIASGLAQTLHDFVMQGGTLVVLPSPRANLNEVNTLLLQLHAPQLEAFEQREIKANHLNTDDALYRNVFTTKPEDMELPTLHNLFRLTSQASTIVSPIITLADGSPYLTVTAAGSGKVYLFATPLQPQHTDFVQQALFVPTLHNMALYSQPAMQPYHLLGTNHTIPLPTLITAESVTLQQVEGSMEMIPEISNANGRSQMLTHNQLHHAGAYQLNLPTTTLALAFNYSRLESKMMFYDAAHIRKAIKDNNLSHYAVVRNADKSLETYVRQQTEGKPLWRYCLVIALLMLLIEEILLRIDQHSKQPTSSK